MAEETFGNYSSCCRLCLSDQFNSLKSIFEDADNTTLVQKILTFVGVEVASNDKVSTLICEQCRTRVDGWDTFKQECSQNQSKLQTWLTSWSANHEIGGTIIQVKDEPVDREDLRQEGSDYQVIIKSELSTEEDYYDAPILSPQQTLDEGENGIELNETVLNGFTSSRESRVTRQSSFCQVVVSSPISIQKNKRTRNAARKEPLQTKGNWEMDALDNGQDEGSQHSVESRFSAAGSAPSLDSEENFSESDLQKIQFAAGLRLKSRALTSNHAIEVPITKVEEAYLERSRALLTMLYTFRCACHNIFYPTVKRLYGHLRATYNWFPIFTCYNCVVTFPTRSPTMKHSGRCSKPYLENSIRLVEETKRTENKIRLYQYCKCTQCEALFAFFEDYCEHIDREHIDDGPFVCKCSKEFGKIEEYKQHMYLSCYLNYYCDICYKVFETLTEFKTHCETEHDKVEDYVFVSYHAEFKISDPAEIRVSRKRKIDQVSQDSQEEDVVEHVEKKFNPNRINPNRINPVAKPVSMTCNVCNRVFSNAYNLKKHMKTHRRNSDVHTSWKNGPSSCDKCGKTFSTYYNMVRHYKTHNENERHLQCALCTDKFRLVSELKDHLVSVHGQANVCQECGKQFESTEELDQHRSVHLNIKVYRDSKTHSCRTGSKTRYTCEHCEAAFETEEELGRHMALHLVTVETNGNGDVDDELKETRYSCVDCDRHYVSCKGLWLHNKRHHPDRRVSQPAFKCEFCPRILQTNAAYQMHKQMHERLMRQNNTLPVKQLPQSSRINDDEDDDYFTCKHCFKVFSTKYNLKTHLKTHGINVSPGRSYSKTSKLAKTFWCDICHQACQGYQELQRHKQEHINENLGETDSVEDDMDVKPQLFNCEICSKVFLTQLAFTRHKNKHLNQPKSLKKTNFVYCKYCKVPFLNFDSLNLHMLREHEEARPKQQTKSKQTAQKVTKKYACNLCKKSFDTSGALCSHQGWHKRGPVSKPYKTEKNLREIKQEEYPEPSTSFQETHACRTCGLCFMTDTSLQLHILEAHRNINATIISPRCNICNMEFGTAEAYETHQQLHRENTSAFKCKYCPKTFAKCESVNMHINQVHPQYNEGRFKCHQCNRLFEKQNALTIHLKVHDRQKMTGVVPKEPKQRVYSCSICHTSFEIAKDLRNHIIAKHPF